MSDESDYNLKVQLNIINAERRDLDQKAQAIAQKIQYKIDSQRIGRFYTGYAGASQIYLKMTHINEKSNLMCQYVIERGDGTYQINSNANFHDLTIEEFSETGRSQYAAAVKRAKICMSKITARQRNGGANNG